VLAAAVLLTGSALILLASVWVFADAAESYRDAGQPLSRIVNARVFAYAVLPFCLSLLGVASTAGLFGLREWARKMAIFLSVAPVTICGLLLLLRPEAIFHPDTGLKVRDSYGWRPGYNGVCIHVYDFYPSERMVAYPFHAPERALSISQRKNALTMAHP
jgi:hypothetical protein